MKKLHYTFILVILAAIGVFLPVEAHADNKYGIVIDGAFEDWKSLPITEFSFSYENGQNIKYVSLVTDESNMYFYLNMAPEGHNYHNLQPSGHKLTIGNKVFWMTFSDLFPSEDLSKVGQTKDVHVNFWAEDNSVNTTVVGKLTRVKTDFSDKSYSDEVEVAVPFEQLKVENTSSQTITYSNSNLGEQVINVTGGSTGPWILAGIAILIAGYSVWRYKKTGSKSNNVVSNKTS